MMTLSFHGGNKGKENCHIVYVTLSYELSVWSVDIGCDWILIPVPFVSIARNLRNVPNINNVLRKFAAINEKYKLRSLRGLAVAGANLAFPKREVCCEEDWLSVSSAMNVKQHVPLPPQSTRGRGRVSQADTHPPTEARTL
ncbi:hypothetical protein CEXT_287611 [Caerostris extrusa]|uniref:Uncharacterized protein n=1 Tax=Caerostris extrusa TaxID=172846 RepID=A0AAV4QA39_CAEEX|nr:hypothetical protein CEXT_287611 [Caerostris extrusa]